MPVAYLFGGGFGFQYGADGTATRKIGVLDRLTKGRDEMEWDDGVLIYDLSMKLTVSRRVQSRPS